MIRLLRCPTTYAGLISASFLGTDKRTPLVRVGRLGGYTLRQLLLVICVIGIVLGMLRWLLGLEPRLERGYSKSYRVAAVAFSPNGELIAVTIDGGHIAVCSLRSQESEMVWYSWSASGVSFSPNGKQLIATVNGKIKVLDLITEREDDTLSYCFDDALTAAFSPDGRFVVISRPLGAIVGSRLMVLDISTQEVTATLVNEDGPIFLLGFSPDGEQVATNSIDGCLSAWNLTSGEREELQQFPAGLTQVLISPNWRLAATCNGWNGTLALWDVASGDKLASISDYAQGGGRVQFSPESNLIAASCNDRAIRLYDTKTGAIKAELKGILSYVTCLAFSPDGSHLACGYEDGTTSVWELATGKESRISFRRTRNRG